MDKNDTVDFLSRLEQIRRRIGGIMPDSELIEPCGCPVLAFQKMISGKYKARIIWDLKDGPRRYGAIRDGLLRGAVGSARISPRVLSRELKALTDSGLIDRHDHGTVPPKVEYQLTLSGEAFLPVIAAVRDWGTRHWPATLAGR
jgi:DNA-binding HxlR family transcriptional regulator